MQQMNLANQANQASTTNYAWRLVALLWVVGLLNYLDRQVIFSLFPLLRAEFQVSDAQLGLVTPAFLWIYGALSPFGGYLADRFGYRKIIIGSLLVWSIVTWLTGHVNSFTQLLGARALMGISEAFYLPAALALISEQHSERTRSLATGLHQSGLYLGIILGGAAGGWLGQRYGWRTAFTWLGVVGVGYVLVLLFGLRASSAAAPSTPTVAPLAVPLDGWQALRTLLANQEFLKLGATFMLFSIAGWIVLTWLPLYLFERFQMTLAGAGFSATFYLQSAAFAGILGGGWLADRWSRTQPRARIWVPVAGFLAGGIFLFGVGWTSSPVILVGCLIVYGMSRGLFDCTAMPILCELVPGHLRATGYGLFNLVGCIVGGTMAALAGALKHALGLNGALQISAGLLILAAWLLGRVQSGQRAGRAA